MDWIWSVIKSAGSRKFQPPSPLPPPQVSPHPDDQEFRVSTACYEKIIKLICFAALVGTLKAAKRKKIVNYSGELLLQGVHDNVDIVLLKDE